jgi:hypothetical protein
MRAMAVATGLVLAGLAWGHVGAAPLNGPDAAPAQATPAPRLVVFEGFYTPG